MTEPYQPLACELYDHLEVACLHGYQLRIELLDGHELQARAITTETHADKAEYLRVRSADGEQLLRLDHLLAITPLDAGARFARVLLANRPC